MPLFVDCGAHLAHRAFAKDLHEVLERAERAGVCGIVALSGGLKQSRASAELALRHPGRVLAAVGFDPAQTRCANEAKMRELADLLAKPGVVGVGVCGLDFEREQTPRPVQTHWFERQAEIAAQARAILFVQERAAAREVACVLARVRDRLAGVVVRCFNGDDGALKRYLDLDCRLGVSGLLADPVRGAVCRRVLARAPLDRLVLESDAPFLLPHTVRPRPRRRRNEPCFLGHVAGALAEVCGRPHEEVALVAADTAQTLLLEGVAPVRARGA